MSTLSRKRQDLPINNKMKKGQLVAQLKRTSWGLNMSSKIWNSVGRRPEVALDALDLNLNI